MKHISGLHIGRGNERTVVYIYVTGSGAIWGETSYNTLFFAMPSESFILPDYNVCHLRHLAPLSRQGC